MASGEHSTPDHDHWGAGEVSSNGAGPAHAVRQAVRLITLGYILAIAIPPVGLVLGIFILARPAVPHARHGRYIIALSLIGAVLWVLVLSTGALTDNSSDLSGY